MKTLIRVIAVFIALASTTSGFAMVDAEEVEKDAQAAQREAQATKREVQATKREAVATYQEALKTMSEQMQVENELQLLRSVPAIPKPPSFRSGRRVLLIPTAEIKAEEFLTVLEDMSVMSRIFNKELALSPGGIFRGGGFSGRGGYGSSNPFVGLSFVGSTGVRSTEAIFMQGYGALFLMKVDFPLSPPAEAERETEPDKDIDALWEETKREIYEPADARRKRADEEEKVEYDEDKVEEMKETLIKALKHAANIRNLKPDEWVILTVTGESSQGRGGVGRVTLSSRQIVVKDQDSKVEKIYEAPISEEMQFTSPAVLTIRVKKSDVDAFARDELDFEGFQKRVQMFIY